MGEAGVKDTGRGEEFFKKGSSSVDLYHDLCGLKRSLELVSKFLIHFQTELIQ